MIEATGICKKYVTDEGYLNALTDVNFELKNGEFAAIMGPSGSGKTTLMNIIGCLDTPDSGMYWLCGYDVANLSRTKLAQFRNRTIGYVFQAFNLLPKLTALENVELPLAYGGVPITKRKARAMDMLERLSIADRAGHVPAKLSGGQKQRVAIARALVNNPSLILADEPTGNLDVETGEEIMNVLSELHRGGCTIALITHSPSVAGKAQSEYLLSNGTLIRRR